MYSTSSPGPQFSVGRGRACKGWQGELGACACISLSRGKRQSSPSRRRACLRPCRSRDALSLAPKLPRRNHSTHAQWPCGMPPCGSPKSRTCRVGSCLSTQIRNRQRRSQRWPPRQQLSAAASSGGSEGAQDLGGDSEAQPATASLARRSLALDLLPATGYLPLSRAEAADGNPIAIGTNGPRSTPAHTGSDAAGPAGAPFSVLRAGDSQQASGT